jgi:hypothetical protein
MALQASGPISFLQISGEFGLPSNKNIGAYRVSQTVGELSNLPLDNNIPQSGAIRFSDFYSKKLNVVMNFGNGSRINARTSYDNNSIGIISVIGGHRIRPTSSSGTKVWIYVSGTITSNSASSQLYCSLLTGNWDNNTDLRLDIGPSGFVLGVGGSGGIGGATGGGNGGNGSPGTSAIGVTYQPITIVNRGTILPGTGGGGGGGGGRRGPGADPTSQIFVGGGGGGGGRPFGPGGDVTTGPGDDPTREPGQPAGLFNQGFGGVGGFASRTGDDGNLNELNGGDGGPGGSSGFPASTNNAAPNAVLGSRGSPGATGFAFVISTDGSAVTIDSGTGTLGGVIYNTSPI